MFGFSLTEVILILAIALVVLGPERIPDVARMLGKAIREVRKASNLMRDALMLDDNPRPRVRPVTPRVPDGTLSQVDDTTWTPDPTPKRDVYLSVCAKPRRVDTMAAMDLVTRKEGEKLREVYLHIPYIETI